MPPLFLQDYNKRVSSSDEMTGALEITLFCILYLRVIKSLMQGCALAVCSHEVWHNRFLQSLETLGTTRMYVTMFM